MPHNHPAAFAGDRTVMPTILYSYMETFVGFLMQSRPRSILDIGLGNGKWEFLARDCLDVMLNESYHRGRWQVRIDGIEAYPDGTAGGDGALLAAGGLCYRKCPTSDGWAMVWRIYGH